MGQQRSRCILENRRRNANRIHCKRDASESGARSRAAGDVRAAEDVRAAWDVRAAGGAIISGIIMAITVVT